MSDENDSTRITKFNGSNFSMWRFQMELVLEAREILTVTNGAWRLNMCRLEQEEASWRKKNSAARVLIGTSVD
jgi:hypothetical protein